MTVERPGVISLQTLKQLRDIKFHFLTQGVIHLTLLFEHVCLLFVHVKVRNIFNLIVKCTLMEKKEVWQSGIFSFVLLFL